ncbi:MAG: proline dehydrogenase family protein [Anaerolineae bacterium]|nr:proline dehydrogenase family protein [Candidatus Roseilinea sp.]MDW8448454.1 proline dehydrogenase family protein [Anaerolineae bacterium]
MLQHAFLALSRAGWAQELITQMPVSRQVAQRFVSGETIGAAIAAVRALNAKGLYATLDFLGESVTSEAEARSAADEYLRALDEIAAGGVRSNVSLKLTHFGLDLDYDFCLQNVRRVVACAKSHGNFVRVDMEGTPHTDRTLAIVRELHREFDNIGAVIQAYLYRSEADLIALADAGIRIRLCKGAYREPPDKAYPHKADVDANYVKLAQLLLDRSANARRSDDGRTPPLAALATHDEKMIAAAKAYAEAQKIPRDQFEFQMLYGVRRELQERLAAEGYAVRIYVPYGTHWYPYFMRRLAERPANVWFFVKSAFSK